MNTVLPAAIDYRIKDKARRQGGSLAELFAEVCARQGDRDAITLDGESITYSELNIAANRIASALLNGGARPGAIQPRC